MYSSSCALIKGGAEKQWAPSGLVSGTHWIALPYLHDPADQVFLEC